MAQSPSPSREIEGLRNQVATLEAQRNDTDEALGGVEEALREVLRDELELRDALDDVLLGVDSWKTTKIQGGDWDNVDELLARWIEAGPSRKLADRYQATDQAAS